jgi:hypothetical protein
MKCLRCGYCCTTLLVVIIKDPEGKFAPSNMTTVGGNGPERCPHLRGDKPGEYACAVHGKRWFRRTGCHEYQSHWPDQNCRMGEFLLKEEKADDGH